MCAQTKCPLTLSSLEWFSDSFHFFFRFFFIIMNYESSYKANNGNDDIFTSIHFHNLHCYYCKSCALTSISCHIYTKIKKNYGNLSVSICFFFLLHLVVSKISTVDCCFQANLLFIFDKLVRIRMTYILFMVICICETFI